MPNPIRFEWELSKCHTQVWITISYDICKAAISKMIKICMKVAYKRNPSFNVRRKVDGHDKTYTSDPACAQIPESYAGSGESNLRKDTGSCHRDCTFFKKAAWNSAQVMALRR